MEEQFKNEIEKLMNYNQMKILEEIKRFSKEEQEQILKDVSSIDFNEMNNLYQNSLKEEPKNEYEISPIDAIDKSKMSEEERTRLEDIGIDIIEKGKYAVITMAGGQRNKAWF